MVPIDQLITALQSLYPTTTPASSLPGFIPGLTPPFPPSTTEQFNGSGSVRDSNFTIDLGPYGNACIVTVTQNANVVSATPQCTVTIKDAALPLGPFYQGSDASAVIENVQGTTPQRFLVTSLQRYVKVNVAVQSGGFNVTWGAINENSPAVESQGLYLSGSTGAFTAANVATAKTIQLGSAQGGGGAAIFDARQATIVISNVATLKTLTAMNLVVSDTTPGGAAISITYPLVNSSTLTGLATGTNGYFIVPLSQGLLKTLSITLTFNSAPVAGQVDVTVFLNGPGGLLVDPTLGLPLHTVRINESTSGNRTLVAGIVGATYTLYVNAIALISAGTVNVFFQDNTAANPVTGPLPLVANSGFSQIIAPPAYFWTFDGDKGIAMNLDASVQVSGWLTYFARIQVAGA